MQEQASVGVVVNYSRRGYTRPTAYVQDPSRSSLGASRLDGDDGGFSMLDSYTKSSQSSPARKDEKERENGHGHRHGEKSESHSAKESALQKLSSVATRDLMPPPSESELNNDTETTFPGGEPSHMLTESNLAEGPTLSQLGPKNSRDLKDVFEATSGHSTSLQSE